MCQIISKFQQVLVSIPVWKYTGEMARREQTSSNPVVVGLFCLHCLFFLGYDSDTECSEHDSHLVAQTRRRNKGKKYVSIASDDPVDYAYFKAVSDRYHGHGEDRGSHQQSPKMSHSDPNLNRECLPGGAVAVGFVPNRYTGEVGGERSVSRSSQRRQHELFPGSPVRSVSSSDLAGGDRNGLQYGGGFSEQNRSSEDVGKVNTYIRQVADGGTHEFSFAVVCNPGSGDHLWSLVEVSDTSVL